jgi:site-specific DNA-methyltransferase (adenine-specific)
MIAKAQKRSKYQIFPPLTPEEYQGLKASIAVRGVDVPTIVDDDGEIIDGEHREKACDELGIFCPREVRHFNSEAEKYELVLTLNVKRRQLNRKQKEALIEAYLLKDPRIADNHLATLIGGVSKNKVEQVRAKLVAGCLIDNVARRRGADGKTYAAKRQPRIVVNTPKELGVAMEAIKQLPPSTNGKTMDATTASRRARRYTAKKERQNDVVEPLRNDSIKLFHCPFQRLEGVAGIAPASVNLICTDIPYGNDFLPQIAELAAMAQRVLVNGGLFVMHSGQFHLDKVMQMLGEHLTYRWMMASEWAGDANMVFPLNLGSQWKPILVYSNGPWVKRGLWYDVSRVEKKEKEWHEWQQPLEEVERLVRYFSEPGDLVVDPCGGGFTTALACRNLGRRCISCDTVEKAVLAGQERLAEGQIVSMMPPDIVSGAKRTRRTKGGVS